MVDVILGVSQRNLYRNLGIFQIIFRWRRLHHKSVMHWVWENKRRSIELEGVTLLQGCILNLSIRSWFFPLLFWLLFTETTVIRSHPPLKYCYPNSNRIYYIQNKSLLKVRIQQMGNRILFQRWTNSFEDGTHYIIVDNRLGCVLVGFLILGSKFILHGNE